MRPGPLNTCLACLYFLTCSAALPRGNGYRRITGAADYASAEGRQHTGPGIPSKEPSCEELRVMWRFSKRQSRAAEITNEIPTYRDPFAYNIWEEYARPRSAGRGAARLRRPIYGRVVHNVQRTPVVQEPSPERLRAFEDVAQIFGSSMYPVARIPSQRKTSFRLGGGASPMHQLPLQTPQSGQFQHLKDLIRTERARELHEQRLKEEAVARAAALKDIVNEVHFGRIVQDQKAQFEQNAQEANARNRGVVAFPDLLAPAAHYLDREINRAKQMYKRRDDSDVEPYDLEPDQRRRPEHFERPENYDDAGAHFGGDQGPSEDFASSDQHRRVEEYDDDDDAESKTWEW